LPAKYAVAHIQNVQTIDLSKLASSSVSSELIDRGDVLDVTIESGYEKDHVGNTVPIRVGEDGALQVPLIGRVQLAGLELAGAEQALRAAAVERGVFRNPSVTVEMKQQRMNKVTVVGAVNEPGTYELPRAKSELLAALMAAKGLNDDAGTDIEIRRPALRSEASPRGPGKEDKVAGVPGELASYAEPGTLRPPSSVRIDLVAATTQTTRNPSWYLDDGDVVMVEKRDLQPVQVIGLVGKPGRFPLPANKDLHLLDAIALAGGTTTPYCNKVTVIRQISLSEEPLVIRVSMREAKAEGKGNLLLGPGDVVSVEQTGPNFAMEMFKTIAPYAFGATFAATLPTFVK
jgi:polysaccharide export outer membrane protein